MDWVKEIFDTANSKIKSPVLGSIIFSFCAVNWKPLFYVAFANATTIEKFGYFDIKTNPWTLFVVPIGVGLLLSWLNPRVKLLALRLTQKPIQDTKILQLKLASERLSEKEKLERQRREVVASIEEYLIAEARRDQEVLNIENQELREKTIGKLESARTARLSNEISPAHGITYAPKSLEDLKDLINFYEQRKEQAVNNSDLRRASELTNKIHDIEDRIQKLYD